VSDAPDPLGKRALFWAPGERQEEGPRAPAEGGVPGKHALFSDGAPLTSPPHAGERARPSGFDRGGPARGAQHRDLRPSVIGAAVGPDSGRTGGPGELERPVGSGMFGSLTLQCSSCRVRSQVDLVEYIVLHLPVWFWRPGRGYTRFMVCPACRRRTWVSASWTSRAR
jgi:hypothetical protein